MTFQDVKVFAGDKFLPAADVAYNNLTWDIVSEKGIRTDGVVYNININIKRVGRRKRKAKRRKERLKNNFFGIKLE